MRAVPGPLAAMEKLKSNGGLAIGKVDPNIPVAPLAPAMDKTGPVRVLVYESKIRDVLATRPAPASVAGGAPAVVGEAIDSEQAWRIAKERAAASLNSGEIPPQYRDIVRNFFEPSAKD